jgi:hypothetical protein
MAARRMDSSDSGQGQDAGSYEHCNGVSCHKKFSELIY